MAKSDSGVRRLRVQINWLTDGILRFIAYFFNKKLAELFLSQRAIFPK